MTEQLPKRTSIERKTKSTEFKINSKQANYKQSTSKNREKYQQKSKRFLL